MFIVRHRKIFYTISAILVLGSIVSFIVWGLKLGIDFKGGSLIEVEFSASRPDQAVLSGSLKPLQLGETSVRATGDKGFIIRMNTLSDAERVKVITAIETVAGKDNKVEVKRFNSIGPLIGKEATQKALMSIALVIICIVLFITFVFRQVSEPVSSWKYGIIAIVALLHDILVPVGVFSLLGHFHGVEVDTLFVTALLVVLGFSIHDTIVVFDRVRENLKLNRLYKERKNFETIVGESIAQTFVRSVNTSLTTILALVVLYVVGSESTRYFSLALIVGIVAGTYSSVFLGSPLLVTVEKWQQKRNK
jgi:preprotein translocase subunit SecF